MSVCYRVVGVSKHLLEVADDVSFDGEKVKICLKHGGKYGKFLQLFLASHAKTRVDRRLWFAYSDYSAHYLHFDTNHAQFHSYASNVNLTLSL